MKEHMKILSEIESGFEDYNGLKYIIENIEEIEFEDIRNIYNLGVIVLGADTFMQNEVNGIIDFIRQKGFNILKMKLRNNLERTEIENLYMPNNKCLSLNTFRWWMIQDSVNLGPSIVVLIHSPSATSEDSCLKQLNRIKGYADPFQGKDGTIRNNFSTINIIMNMIHIPDSYSDFFKDTYPFFTMNEIISTLREIKDNRYSQAGRECYLSKAQKFEILINSNDSSFKKSFFKSLYIMKFQLLKALTGKYAEAKVLMDICIDSVEKAKEYDRYKSLILMRDSNGIEADLAQKILKAIKAQVADDNLNYEELIDKLSDLKKIYFHLLLCNENNFKNIKAKQFNEIQCENVYLSELDRNILITSFSQWKNYKI